MIPNARKKISKMHVAIAQKKGSVKLKNDIQKIRFVERKIFGVGKTISQKTYFHPKKNLIKIKLERAGKEIGKLEIGIKKIGTYKEAFFSDAFIKKTMREKGLYSQVVAQALDVLTKSGVNTVRFEATGGHSVLKKMGFESKSQFGSRIYYKELNPQKQVRQ